MCAEGVDNQGATQRFFFGALPNTSSAKVSTKRIESGSFIQVSLPAEAITKERRVEKVNLVLTPYYAWNNRGVSSMTVWFPREERMAVFDRRDP